jgi:hypothetical protein
MPGSNQTVSVPAREVDAGVGLVVVGVDGVVTVAGGDGVAACAGVDGVVAAAGGIESSPVPAAIVSSPPPATEIVSVFVVVAPPQATGLKPNHSSPPTTLSVAVEPASIEAVTAFAAGSNTARAEAAWASQTPSTAEERRRNGHGYAP